MEVTVHYSYDIAKGMERIDEILGADNSQITEKRSVQPRKYLTYSNGFYSRVTVIYIDIVGSKDLNDKHRATTIAKIHRAFISEVYAILMSEESLREINLVGDSVWGVFDTPDKEGTLSVMKTAGRILSFVDVLNARLRKKRYSELSVGIGIDAGRALMVKAGYSGSGMNDVIWMGDVVIGAKEMSAYAGRNGIPQILISERIAVDIAPKERKQMVPLLINKAKYYGTNTTVAL